MAIMILPRVLIIAVLVIGATIAFPTNNQRSNYDGAIPPKPRHQGVFAKDYNHESIAKVVGSWTPEKKENAWELSGLFEGDIMMYPTDGPSVVKNGLLDETTRWPTGMVPLYIKEDDFDEDKIKRIKAAVKEYHEKTCLRFRPYKEGDEDYVIIQGSKPGCWSSVGRHGKGQVLNLQPNGCMSHGTIIHELMHALGFFHQQSTPDRDDYVTIHWENISDGKESNFNKYDEKTVTDYGIGYDYGSVMHYSGFAFSKNGERTITPLEEGAEIGQRVGLSEKDISKLQTMYKKECAGRKPAGSSEGSDESSLIDSLGWWLE